MPFEELSTFTCKVKSEYGCIMLLRKVRNTAYLHVAKTQQQS